jgi:hypothetical protein
MPRWRHALDEWFRTHHGVINTTQLLGLGCSLRTLRRMVASGELRRVFPGVFIGRQWPDSQLQQFGAMCARDPDVVVAFTSGCHHWGYRRVEDTRLHALVPHTSALSLDGVIVHRCRQIDPVEMVQRPDGIRVTSPPRTLFDSADMLGLSAARSVMEQILHEGYCTLETIIDTFVRLRHPHRPGSRTMADVLASRPKWRAALHSDLEHRVLEEVARQGLPPVVAQCPVVLPGGRTIHLDFGWPEWKLGLEVDDPAWHAGVEPSRRDAYRDRKAAVVGWHVLRVSKIDVQGLLAEAIGDVREVMAQRRSAA